THSRCAAGSRGSVSVVESLERTSWFQIAAIWERSISRAARSATRGGDAALRGSGQGWSEAKEPPAPRVEPGAIEAILREHFEGVVARVHAPHHAADRPISEINCLDRYDQVFFDLSDVNIQLAHLQTLATVARHGSFSRAAREPRLTQPTGSMLGP